MVIANDFTKHVSLLEGLLAKPEETLGYPVIFLLEGPVRLLEGRNQKVLPDVPRWHNHSLALIWQQLLLLQEIL